MNSLSRQFVSRLGEQESKAVYLHKVSTEGPIEDNTHFSERGAYAMAAMVVRELDSLRLEPQQRPTNQIMSRRSGSGQCGEPTGQSRQAGTTPRNRSASIGSGIWRQEESKLVHIARRRLSRRCKDEAVPTCRAERKTEFSIQAFKQRHQQVEPLLYSRYQWRGPPLGEWGRSFRRLRLQHRSTCISRIVFP